MSQGPAATSIQEAPVPFSGEPDPEDKSPAPDFIIRSGDAVDFHVHKTILSFASPFFNHMFSGAGNSGGMGEGGKSVDLQRDGKIVVVLPESSAVLYRLLCLAYPAHSLVHYSLDAHNLDGVWEVHKSANKYLFIDVQNLVENMLESPSLLDAHPHRVFAIARLCDLHDIARKAALSTLKSPICPPDLLFPELDRPPASTFQKLSEFHHSCGRAAEQLAEANLGPLDYTREHKSITNSENENCIFVWWIEGASPEYHDGQCGPDVEWGYQGEWTVITPSPWFKNTMESLAPKLRFLPIRGTVATGLEVVADADRAMIDGCHACLEHADRHLRDFWHQLGLRIEASNNTLAAVL
ncbi:hypothetical protein DFH07DRAFT_819483 [Mycena maculata]|uniref:BTB domain-containing protein n=1 Tax=Mycena maculata TaxID=230809 RepID=A0AAD7J562_9AGAR|nr:hypothetical protein DFH07DRAFT_819483 [Mycena maculata]